MTSTHGAGYGEFCKALRFKVLYKTNEVEEQLQTSGYCNSPEESQ